MLRFHRELLRGMSMVDFYKSALPERATTISVARDCSREAIRRAVPVTMQP